MIERSSYRQSPSCSLQLPFGAHIEGPYKYGDVVTSVAMVDLPDTTIDYVPDFDASRMRAALRLRNECNKVPKSTTHSNDEEQFEISRMREALRLRNEYVPSVNTSDVAEEELQIERMREAIRLRREAPVVIAPVETSWDIEMDRMIQALRFRRLDSSTKAPVQSNESDKVSNRVSKIMSP